MSGNEDKWGLPVAGGELDGEFNSYVKGKRVALVGPAPSIIDSKQRDLIDSFDLVVRINKAMPVPPELHDDTGERCDILYNCLDTSPDSGGKLNLDMLDEKGVSWIACPYPRHGIFDRQIRAFEGKNNGRFKFHVMDLPFYSSVATHIGTRPNSGIGALLDLLRHDIAELYVTGFTFFKGGYHKHYRGLSEDQVMKFMASAGNHSQAPQENLIKSIFNADDRFVADSELELILSEGN